MKKKVLTKALIVDHLNESIGLSKRECQNFFENFLEILCDQLKSNNDVKIFGKEIRNSGYNTIKSNIAVLGKKPYVYKEPSIKSICIYIYY